MDQLSNYPHINRKRNLVYKRKKMRIKIQEVITFKKIKSYIGKVKP